MRSTFYSSKLLSMWGRCCVAEVVVVVLHSDTGAITGLHDAVVQHSDEGSEEDGL